MASTAPTNLRMLSPSVAAYNRVPAIWITADGVRDPIRPQFGDEGAYEIVFEGSLECGISVRVHRSGIFKFDFTNFPELGQITIPQNSDSGDETVQQEVHAGESRAENIAAKRASLMNVHQACMETTGALFGSGASITGEEISYLDVYNSWDIATNQSPSKNYLSHAKPVQNLQRDPAAQGELHPPPRKFSQESVEKSFQYLDRLIAQRGEGALEICEAIYIAARRLYQRRFNESVVLSWASIEQAVNKLWTDLIEEKSSQYDLPLTGARAQKLNVKSVNASTKIEMLAMEGRLIGSYDQIETARTVRNRWAHRLVEVSLQDAWASYQAAVQLFERVFGMRLHLQPLPPGGVPWISERLV